MELPKGVEWAAHCLVVLARADDASPLSTAALAATFGLSPTYLNKQLQALARAGLVTSEPGARGGFALARSADEVTLAEVVAALRGPEPMFRCTEIRRQGIFADLADPSAPAKVCGIAQAMYNAEAAWTASLASVTVADLAAQVPARSTRRLQDHLGTDPGTRRPAPRPTTARPDVRTGTGAPS